MIRLNLVRIADSVGAFDHLVPGDAKVIWELSIKATDKDNGDLTNRVERLRDCARITSQIRLDRIVPSREYFAWREAQ